MWGSTTSPPHWRHSIEGSATIDCEGSHLKGSSDESILLQGPIGLGPSEEDVLQTEKAESDGEAEYTEETVIPVPPETTADGNANCDRQSSTNCFSLVQVVKPERELPLRAGQNEGLMGCQNHPSTDHAIPENAQLAVDSRTLPQKLKISPNATSEPSQCPPPVSANDTANETSPPCGSSPSVSSTTPVLPYAVPLGNSGIIPPGTSEGRPWASSAPRLPTVSVGALPGVGHRFSGLGGPSILPSAFSLAGNAGPLCSWPQHPKQQQQQNLYLRPHLASTTAARQSGNMPVILTALRRYLRSLIRIMYNKQLGRTNTTSSPVPDGNAFQREQEHVLYGRETRGGCGVSLSVSEHTSAPCCLKAIVNGSQAEYAQCSAAVELHELPRTCKKRAQDGSLMASSKHGDGLSEAPTVNPQLRHPPPQEAGTESQSAASEATAVSGAALRGTAPIPLAGSPCDAPLAHLGSVDGAAESWEGQRYFHEEHLDGCSISELSEYLQIFASFLSLSLPEVSRQEPTTLQHVRLQLLLLRNSHQQQPNRLRQAKQILHRWPPILQHSAAGGADPEDDSASLNGSTEATISPVDVCLRSTGPGVSRPSMPFSSTNLSFLSSFSPSPSSQVDIDAPSIAPSAVSGEKPANGGGVSTGECETAPEQTAVRAAEFPSSSVDAFSVDGPPSNNNAATIGTPTAVTDCQVPPPVPTTFVGAAANDQPGDSSGIPPCKDKLPLHWNSDGSGTAGTAITPSTGLRWSPLSGSALGIRLHSLIGGTSLGLGLLQQSRAFSVATLGFEGAKKTAQQYATHCRRQCSSKRASDRGGKGKGGEMREDGTRNGSRGPKETRKAGSAVTPIPQVTIGLAGPPGGAFNLAKSNNQDFILPKSDFSASRVARLSRRAMELPYVHGVRFEAANFAWVAQMRGEARRFLVKKHGFVKSRLCAIEKIEMWRAALSPEALASELKAEQDVLAMVPNMCPEETDPEAMQAVEESLRLKFQRGTIMSCRASGSSSVGIKRQRNICLDTERETSKANRSHDTFFEQLLIQQQQVIAAQQLISQPGVPPDGQRHQFQLTQPQFVQASQQQLADSSQHQLLTQEHLLRAIALPASNADPTAGREAQEQAQHQQMSLSLQGFRTRGQQQQQLLAQQLPSALPILPGMRLQQQTIAANSQHTRAASD
ncbi:hypothetical protein, conserved [Eimeria brunetti]|uniref:Uncharacterized protein n=1 Tax=Eimeria brunetti TaxID=51314 RepID=U6LVD0_9EIME|nr:hypothetical protein, conserved [Eimeria brunetti]